MTSKWKTVRLGDVANIQQGKKVPLSPIGVDGYPVLGATGVIGSWHVPTYYEPRVALGCRGTVGNTRIIAKPAWFGNNVMAVWPKDEQQIDLKFLGHVISWTDLVAQGAVGGQVQKQITRTGLSPVRIPLPPLPEQRRIVDLIGALDDAIEAAEERVSAAQTAELQVLDDLVGKPENSQSRTIGELFDVIDCEHKTAPESQTDIFAYSVGTGAIRDGAFRLDRAKPVSKDTYEAWTQRAAPASGDVVLTREAPVGEVALVTADLGPICLGQRTVLLRQKAELPGPVLWAALRTAHYQSLFTQNSIGLTVSRINIKAIKMLKLPELDPERIDTIGAISTQFLNEIESAQEVVASLRTLRTELLTALLSGAHEIPESYDSVMELADA